MANPAYVRHVRDSRHSAATDTLSRRIGQSMAKEKVFILAVFALVIAAAIGIGQLDFGAPAGTAAPSPSQAGTPTPSRPSGPPLKPPPVKQFRGFTLQLQSADHREAYKKYIDEIADTGANAICLSVAGYQENCSSTSIFIDARRSPSAGDLKLLIAHAKTRGLRVMLMPIVLLENPRTGEWRGKIKPRDWDDWWEDYTNYILHNARIARDAGATILAVGSELVSTEKDHADRWRGLIAAVRKVFKGYLIYSANWDH